MRDITPNRRKRSLRHTPSELPLEAKELYEKQQKRKPRFAGSKVPVSSVHIPRATQTPKRPRVESPTAKPVTMDRRPLFADPPKKTKKKKRSMGIAHKERKVISALLFVLILVAGLAGYIFLPNAEITLSLQTAPLLVDETLAISQTPQPDMATLLGTSFVQEIQVEGSVQATGSEVVGEKARGTAIIFNRTSQEQPMREESRLVTEDGTLFYMKNHAILPPAGAGSPSQVRVPIEAAEPGEKGNIEPQRLTFAALDQSAQAVLYAEVTEALTGGEGEEVQLVQEEDLERAREEASEDARKRAEESIQEELQDQLTILQESWDIELQDLETNASVGDEVEEITYTARAIVQVIAYDKDQLTKTLAESLESRLDEHYMLFPGPLSYTTSVQEVDWESSTATIVARVTHTTIPTFSLDTLRGRIAGRSQTEAREYLQGLPGVQSASIELWPFWANRIPRIERRVDLNLVSDRRP